MNIWRVRIFRLLAIFVVPSLLFLMLEGGLRLFGYGYNPGFTVPCEVNGQKAYCENNSFGQLFFPPKIAREPRSFAIPAKKDPGTYRIFIFGGSVAEGDPEPSYGFSRILELMLRDQYPDVNFEIINTGMTSINSHVVFRIAKDVARLQPDLFIIYLGNNEVVGPFGAGTVLSSFSPSLEWIRTSLILKSTRTGQLISNLLAPADRAQDFSRKWLGMEMFLKNQLRADDPRLEGVYHHFERNLNDILRISTERGIKTVISTVATNLRDSAPFASLHRPDLTKDEERRWDEMYESAIELEASVRYTEAIQRYLEAAEIDDRYADLHYRLGRSYWALEDYEKALFHYTLARDLDTLRFRADTRINNIIRAVAEARAAEGVTLVDSERDLLEHGQNGIPGNDLFYEHAHFVFTGNYLIAKNLFRQIQDILPDWLSPPENPPPLLTEEQCVQRLAFTGYDRYRIAVDIFSRISRAPFSNQLDHEEQYARMQEELNALLPHTRLSALKRASLLYRQAVLESRGMDPWLYYNFARMLQNSNNPMAASELLKMFLQQLPHYYPAYEKLASALIQEGKFEEAIEYSRKALKIKPTFYEGEVTIAIALAQMGKHSESLNIYKKLLDRAPEMSVQIYNAMGQILAQEGNFDEAAKAFRSAIESNPEPERERIPEIHANLGYTLKRLGMPEEASKELDLALIGYTEEIRRYPLSGPIHAALGQIFVEVGDLQEAVEHFHQAVSLDPDNADNHFYFSRALELQGRNDEATEAARKAAHHMSEIGQEDASRRLEAYRSTLQRRQNPKIFPLK